MSEPELILGIDTGGTYTDAVIVDYENCRVVSKAKSLTTPDDLSIGIAAALDGLPSLATHRVRLVCLSTTLATNAIVEAHGWRVGLILIGYDREIVRRNSLESRLPVERMSYIDGGHDVKGEELCPLDTETAVKIIEEFQATVDAIAVCSFFSVMNPDHELRVQDLVSSLTGLPAVCGHELSNQLDAIKRAITAVHNARLLPIVQDFLDAVKSILSERGIQAPLMIVRSDCSLMSERVARQRPVDTILSGPAASAIGGQFLSGIEDAIVVDMGGTTTDIAMLQAGGVATSKAGAIVGGWNIYVQAASLSTIGIGGDSHIRVDKDKTLQVGPRRAIPLCQLGEHWPRIVRELEAAAYSGVGRVAIQPSEYILQVRPERGIHLGNVEKAILDKMRDGPLLLSDLGKILDNRFLSTERLERLGIVRRAGLTPTDVFWSHYRDLGGNGAAAKAGVQIAARQIGLPEEEFTRRVLMHIVDTIAIQILDRMVREKSTHSLLPVPNAWKYLLDLALDPQKSAELQLSFAVTQPIIAIGAPVGTFIPHVAEKLHTQCIIPPNAEVGNAVGAAVAGISQTVEILVQPMIKGAGTVRYLIHSPKGREEVRTYTAAVRRAETLAGELARKAAYQAGAKEVSVKIERREVNLGSLSEMTIRARAQGRPRGAV